MNSRDNNSGRCEEDVDCAEKEDDSQESKPGEESEDTRHVFFLSVVVSIQNLHHSSK